MTQLFWELPSWQWEGTDTSLQQGWCWDMQIQLPQWLIIQYSTLQMCMWEAAFCEWEKTSQDFLSPLNKKMALPVSAIINTGCWAAAFGNHFSGYVYQYRLFKQECINYIFLALPLINGFSINWSKKFLGKQCFLDNLGVQITKKEEEIKNNLNFVSWTVNLTWRNN